MENPIETAINQTLKELEDMGWISFNKDLRKEIVGVTILQKVVEKIRLIDIIHYWRIKI